MRKIEYSYEKHSLKWWHAPLLLLLIVGSIITYKSEHGSVASDSAEVAIWNRGELQRLEGSVFGTIYHITYQSPSDLSEGIKATLQKVDDSLSPFNKKSTITAINNGTSMKADSMFIHVFNLAHSISEETNGAFDITVAPLVNLWGFGFKNEANVNKAAVDSLLQYVGYGKVSLDGDIVKKECAETMLDCSAIAKGYGVDAVADYLESQSVTNYMVEIGGEIRLCGHNPKGVDWSIGITKPVDDSLNTQNDIQQVIQTTDIAMATSGNYRNFYVKDGRKYAHTIDPRTGNPVQHSILSSTVLAKDCATADAYATSFMVLGLDGAKRVLDRHPELMAYFIYADANGSNAVWCSKEMDKLLKK